VITVSTGLAVGLAAALLAVDLLAWRVVAAMFDRERLVTADVRDRRRHAASLAEHPATTPLEPEEISNVRNVEADA
jgi:hypothetical protein